MTDPAHQPVLRMFAHHLREVILSRADLAALSAFVQAEFPHAVILRSPNTTSMPPETIPTFPSLVDTEDWYLEMFLPREKWIPKAIPEEKYGKVPNHIWRWALDRHPTPRLIVRRSDSVRAGKRLILGGQSPPAIGKTSIQITYNRVDEDERKAQGRIWRHITKLTTNELSIMYWPEREISPSRPYYRAGHDAVRWCREDPRRVFAFQENAAGGCSCHIPNDMATGR